MFVNKRDWYIYKRKAYEKESWMTNFTNNLFLKLEEKRRLLKWCKRKWMKKNWKRRDIISVRHIFIYR